MDNNIKNIEFSYDGEIKNISYDMYPISLNGVNYNLTDNYIYLVENRVKINFALINPAFIEHVKAFISYSITKYAEKTVENFFHALQNLFSKIDVSVIEPLEKQIKNFYIETLNDISIEPSYKSNLRNIYRFYADEYMPYFDQDFVDFYLDEISFGSGNKGLDVLIEIKNRGCLTLSEQRKFKKSIAYIDYKSLSLIELQGFIALRIGQLTGARDVQVRNLKGKHFKKKERDRKTVYFLQIPRAKQRGMNRKNQVVTRPITQRLGEQIEYLLTIIKMHNVSDIEEHFLLFPVNAGSRGLIVNKIHNKILLSDTFTNRVNAISNKMELDFTVNLRRLRKTFCSLLVARSVSMKTIAYLMDHSDLQQLAVYYRQTHSVAKNIDAILKKEASDILDAFLGKIIEEGEESQQGQLIFAPTRDTKLIKIGSCGSGKLCQLNPPLSCYSCKSLEAFEDVDHSEVLSQLTLNTKETFGDEHAVLLAQDKNFLAAGALIKLIESGDYE